MVRFKSIERHEDILNYILGEVVSRTLCNIHFHRHSYFYRHVYTSTHPSSSSSEMNENEEMSFRSLRLISSMNTQKYC